MNTSWRRLLCIFRDTDTVFLKFKYRLLKLHKSDRKVVLFSSKPNYMYRIVKFCINLAVNLLASVAHKIFEGEWAWELAADEPWNGKSGHEKTLLTKRSWDLWDCIWRYVYCIKSRYGTNAKSHCNSQTLGGRPSRLPSLWTTNFPRKCCKDCSLCSST